MGFLRGRLIILLGALLSPGLNSAQAQFHTVRFLDPTAVPTGHLPDTGGILHPTSHNFQEDGVHVEAVWAPSTHEGFIQGHFHHIENGFETSHGFGDADAEGWYDLQGFYLKMVDGRPFTLISIDYRLRVDLQNTDILATAELDPIQSFTGQFVHHPVGRFSTFKTLTFSGFENLDHVFVSTVLAFNNTDQIQYDNIVVWTAPPVFGACCAAEGLGCDQQEQEDCLAGGGTYLGDNVACTSGAYCPTRVGACCLPSGTACEIKTPDNCTWPDGVFAGLQTDCGAGGSCPIPTGKCCVENGAACNQVLAQACTGPDTYFHGEGTICVAGQDCFVPCDTDVDCDDADACNGVETCDLNTGVCLAGNSPDCNDQNACTVDTCDATNGCGHSPLGCDDADPCTIDSCDPQTGCTHGSVVCSDDDACNGLETCNPETGFCQPRSALDCDDQNACTLDSCDSGKGCVHLSVVCDDENLCTADACDPVNGCEHSAVECDDQDSCTADSCDSVLGCVHEVVVCDDGDVCNGLELCNPQTGACESGTELDCDDRDACTFDKCAPSSGCGHTARDCDDDDPCTVDSCDESEGCVHVAVICDDGDACNGLESCNAETGQCDMGQPLICDDADACTVDACDSVSGCGHVEVDCDDENLCTKDLCDPLLGCAHEPVVCDDGDACTVDACDPLIGCKTAPQVCEDQDACTVDSCDADIGCRFEPLCADGLACVDGECTCYQPLGDRNGNGLRDASDLVYLLPCMAGPGVSAEGACLCDDLNDDGFVDLADLAEFLITPDAP